MSTEIRYIDLKRRVLKKNKDQADRVREQLSKEGVFLVNVMASPGSGKTSLIIETIRRMKQQLRIGVIEGDIESLVDSEKIVAEGVPAVQLRTGGSCHLDAAMISAALEEADLSALDVLFVENIGNLVCPASFDIGAAKRVMILSVPEGDDKILKYPMMFTMVDALVVNKMDYLGLSNFNLSALRQRMQEINPSAAIFEVSCRTGAGVDEWCNWLREQVQATSTACADTVK